MRSEIRSRQGAKRTLEHRCTGCGHRSPRWFGRCPECNAWSSAESGGLSLAGDAALVTSLADRAAAPPRLPTGMDEVDRVLGGGLVAGSVVLLAGEPGIGKSTLILQIIGGILARGERCLLATGEESLDQVALRAGRLGVPLDRVRAAATSSLQEIVSACSAETPDVLVVDSIQTVESDDVEQGAGSVVQVRESSAALVAFAKRTGTVVIMVGHVTKEGSVAGPKTLEHMVDVVIALDGDRSGTLRVLRASKNRFGSCDETGVFVMSGAGLEDVADPSAMLLEDRHAGVPGSVVFPGLEGSRPMLVEVQGLVTPTQLVQPRRVAIGLDARRLSLVLAVLSKSEVSFGQRDVFAAAAGGLAIREPAADLAVCVAMESALTDRPIDPGLVAIGEIGLGGEVRRVPGVDRRIAEAERLGFTSALVPRGSGRISTRLRVHVVEDVGAAIEVACASRVA